jgi:ADP-dependent NAD(P)H-hydrate dehydratase / NAD(P)H-hydrate epimerase
VPNLTGMGTPLFTIAELRVVEQTAQQGLAEGELMARAGRAAARWIDSTAGASRADVCVVAGPGNNGGDGFVVARELRERGHRVTCVLIGPAEPTAPDAAAAFGQWRQTGGTLDRTLPDREFDIVVDALFGIGLARPLDGEFLSAATWINERGRRVVAIDVPSGLDSDRGAWVGGIAGVRAHATVTFLGDKPGLHTGVGLDAVGDVHVDALGVVLPPSGITLTDVADFAVVARPRERDSHKGTFGNAGIVGGGTGMVGAPLLAARAALRLGTGRVYVDCIGAPELRVDPFQPELMFRRYAGLSGLDAVVVGCGLGDDPPARAALAWALEQPAALVIDADGLNLLASESALRDVVRQRGQTTVITPHPLEAARLIGSSAHEIQADRVGTARRLARELKCFVVLKGAGTVCAAPDGRAAINPTGSPALATAGTGDVLAGMLGALLAQHYEAWPATLAAVWLHGEAVRECGDVGIVAGDLAPRAVDALRALRRGG